jgi:hypothetical protein
MLPVSSGLEEELPLDGAIDLSALVTEKVWNVCVWLGGGEDETGGGFGGGVVWG